ncbi:MAG: acyl-CoA dehydratase activase-related protein [Coriobacteriales bacterium]
MKTSVFADLADVHVIGIPRALLQYRYGVLWQTFFEKLGKEVVLSDQTDKAIVDAGIARSVDETCLASKIFMGHVVSLIGRCDAVFVPCYASCDMHRGFCTKFQSMTDLVRNTFRAETRVISLLVENLSDAKAMQAAFIELGQRLGAARKDAKAAYKEALRAQKEADEQRARNQEEILKLVEEYRDVVAKDPSNTEQAPLSILVVAHPYIVFDQYMAGDIIRSLKQLDCTALFACDTDHAKAYKASLGFSSTMPWVISRELIGSILMLKDEVDGIILISAFPCGPDSMTGDAIMRCIQGVPILNLMIDAQTGTAGVQTRLESFIDILQFQRKGGYIRD